MGTKRLLELLNKITDGKGTMEDLDKITELAEFIKSNSLCGLGQTAPNPVLSTLRYFRDEYVEHIVNKRCPAGVCKALLNYKIDPVKCKGCTLCARTCPAGAISGTVRQPHTIDTAKVLSAAPASRSANSAPSAKVKRGSDNEWKPYISRSITCPTKSLPALLSGSGPQRGH